MNTQNVFSKAFSCLKFVPLIVFCGCDAQLKQELEVHASSLTQVTPQTVDLRVLLITSGDSTFDAAQTVMITLLEGLQIPYTVLDSSTQDLTADLLWEGGHGFYNGIILTNAETYGPNGIGFSAAEFNILHQYERNFLVREAVMSGFPPSNLAAGIDYGMASATFVSEPIGTWTPAAQDSTRLYEDINKSSNIAIKAAGAFTFIPRDTPQSPVVTTLLDSPAGGLIGTIEYADGREVLLSTIQQAPWLAHSFLLGYEFLNYATRGVFLGARRVYLSAHVDDLFLADEVWNPSTNSNFPESEFNYRMDENDVIQAVSAQDLFRAQHPLAQNLTLEFAFNGGGIADIETDSLAQAFIQNKNQFSYINHGLEAIQMDRLCEDPDAPSLATCPQTQYLDAFQEISQNMEVWAQLGLPNQTEGQTVYLSDSHSGFEDRRGSLERADHIPYPWGLNDMFISAAFDNGIRWVATDTSRPNQNIIQRIDAFPEVGMLPRFPTQIYYNTTTPLENTSEYNYIFNGRHIEDGRDPCNIPGAICTPRTYEEILASEAEVTFNHMMNYQPFPHYFHQTNLAYSQDIKHGSLLFDWLYSVIEYYEERLILPVMTPTFVEVAAFAAQRLERQEAEISAVMDLSTDTVRVTSNRPATIYMTGIAGGQLYGGQYQTRVNVDTVQVLSIDRAEDTSGSAPIEELQDSSPDDVNNVGIVTEDDTNSESRDVFEGNLDWLQDFFSSGLFQRRFGWLQRLFP